MLTSVDKTRQDKVLHKIKNINILYNTTIVHLLDCARLWAPTKGNLECVCARSGVCKEDGQDLCERESGDSPRR